MQNLDQVISYLYDNREEIYEILKDLEEYRCRATDNRLHITFDPSGTTNNSEWTLILIDGAVWQYSYYNPRVSYEPDYISCDQAARNISLLHMREVQ